ncbi:MAG: rhodanese-like domain-containing protein [Alphaproteobacteria bacterium]
MFKPAVVIAALLAASMAYAATPRDNLVVGDDWLAQHLNDANLIILHSGSPADYNAGHIAGARLAAQDALSVGGAAAGGLTLELPKVDELRNQMQAMGISDNSKVVVYATRDVQAATRLILTLDAAGMGDKAVLLDGGLNEWKRTGHPTVTDPTPAKTGTLAALKMQPRIVDQAFVQSHAKSPGYVLIDARAGQFYDGVAAGGAPPTKGHIPGAKSIPFSSITGADGKLKPADQLQALFTAAGVKAGDHVMVYCHVGQQATAVIFAARTLGIDAQLYDGSFQDWSAKGLPVELPPAAAG